MPVGSRGPGGAWDAGRITGPAGRSTVGTGGIAYLYLETRRLDESIGFWQALGYEVALRVDDAARLVHPGGSAVWLQGASGETPLACGVYLTATGAIVDDPPVTPGGPVVETHWGSRIRPVRDPDGREFLLEARSEVE